jgi:hypothetical protein
MILKVDPDRLLFDRLGGTGVYVRAKNGETWVNADVAELDRESLLEWLRASPTRAEEMVLIMMGHPRASADVVLIRAPR